MRVASWPGKIVDSELANTPFGFDLPPRAMTSSFGVVSSRMPIGNHDGTPLGTDAHLIGAPSQIGTPTSATVFRRSVPRAIGRALVTGLIMVGPATFLLGTLIVLGSIEKAARGSVLPAAMAMLYGGGMVLGFLGMMLLQVTSATSWVGTHGMALYVQRGFRTKARGDEARFVHIAEFDRQETRKMVAGVYALSRERCVVRDHDRRVLLSFTSIYKQGRKEPTDNFVHFRIAAIRAFEAWRRSRRSAA